MRKLRCAENVTKYKGKNNNDELKSHRVIGLSKDHYSKWRMLGKNNEEAENPLEKSKTMKNKKQVSI